MTGDVSRFINEKSYYLFVLFADETINMPPSDYEVNPTLALKSEVPIQAVSIFPVKGDPHIKAFSLY